jgi:hypothetical protein
LQPADLVAIGSHCVGLDYLLGRLREEGFRSKFLAVGSTAGLEAVRRGECDLAVGAFARRVGGGFGLALGFSRWAVRRRAGVELEAPISGQRAMRGEVLPVVVPFARGFGMETAMNIDAARAGFRIAEIELDLEHRATGRTLSGFVHRGRQLLDFVRVYLDRR